MSYPLNRHPFPLKGSPKGGGSSVTDLWLSIPPAFRDIYTVEEDISSVAARGLGLKFGFHGFRASGCVRVLDCGGFSFPHRARGKAWEGAWALRPSSWPLHFGMRECLGGWGLNPKLPKPQTLNPHLANYPHTALIENL